MCDAALPLFSWRPPLLAITLFRTNLIQLPEILVAWARRPLAKLTFAFICGFAVVASAQSGSRGMFGGGNDNFRQKEEERPKVIPFLTKQNGAKIVEIRIAGNRHVNEHAIRSMMQTRTNRVHDPIQVQRDVRTLMQTGSFYDVRTYTKKVPHQGENGPEDGVILTFEVKERPLANYVRFVGNEKIKDGKLMEQVGIRPGDPLNHFAVEEGRRRIEQFYKQKGYSDIYVSTMEGTKANDTGIVYQINEGQVVRIRRTTFSGNKIASDARLKTLIQSKPGILWVFGGKANQDEIDQDVDRLTAYYRSLGYFRARVGRQVEFNGDKSWATINFIIDEGPRYRISDVRLEGSDKVHPGALVPKLSLRKGQHYNMSQLQRDLNMLRDEYGSRGYIAADIQAEPTFHEEPGKIDLVYHVDEGKQYRVGRILVNIDGGQSQTKRTVVLNRLSVRPGDIVDVREIRRSERRLQGSSLFMHEPATGVTPEIVVKPRLGQTEVAQEQGSTYRGQSTGEQW